MSEEFKITFLDSHQLGSIIVINGYKFRSDKDQYYKCCNCSCRAIVDFNENKEITKVISVTNKSNQLHDHEDDVEKIENERFKFDVFVYAMEHPLIANKDIVKHFEGITSEQVSQIKKLYKKKLKLPLTFDDLKTKKINLILAHDENFMILGQSSGLFILAQSVIILLDATFEIVNNVGQMLIVHGIVNNTCSACLFVKMKNKSEETYVKVLKCIQKLGEERNVNIFKRDIAIKSDFENSLLAACKHTFSEPKHSGCFFHFVCNIRKSAEKKSRQLFNNDPNFRKLVRRVSMMCLLPKEYISPGVVDHVFKLYEDTLEDAHNDEYTKFKNYMLSTWFGTGRYFQKIPTSVWNVCDMEIRTNNLCESSHRVINSSIKNKIDMISCIELIKQTFENDKMKTLRENNILGKRITKEINKELRILVAKLRDKKMYFVKYLDLVGMLIEIKKNEELQKFKSDYMNREAMNSYARSIYIRQQRSWIIDEPNNNENTNNTLSNTYNIDVRSSGNENSENEEVTFEYMKKAHRKEKIFGTKLTNSLTNDIVLKTAEFYEHDTMTLNFGDIIKSKACYMYEEQSIDLSEEEMSEERVDNADNDNTDDDYSSSRNSDDSYNSTHGSEQNAPEVESTEQRRLIVDDFSDYREEFKKFIDECIDDRIERRMPEITQRILDVVNLTINTEGRQERLNQSLNQQEVDRLTQTITNSVTQSVVESLSQMINKHMK